MSHQAQVTQKPLENKLKNAELNFLFSNLMSQINARLKKKIYFEKKEYNIIERYFIKQIGRLVIVNHRPHGKIYWLRSTVIDPLNIARENHEY